MTIKVGTLCLLIPPAYHAGCIVRVVSSLQPIFAQPYGGAPARLAHGHYVEFAGATPADVVAGHRQAAEPRVLVPLNDPDNAPADPAYTKRRTHA